MKKDLKLSIPDSYLDTLSNTAIAIYLELECMFYCSNEKEVIVNGLQIGYSLYNKFGLNRTRKRDMDCGLNELVKANLLRPVTNMYYSLNPEDFHIESGYFKRISVEAFLKLKNDSNLLKHFLLIIKSRNSNIEINGVRGIVSTMPISFFEERESVCSSTIYRYNSTLEEMNLIYIGRTSYDPKSGDRQCNVYSLYEHRGFVDQYVGYYNQGDNSTANFRRKVSARYNRFANNPRCYSPEEIAQLKSDVAQYNKQMQDLGGDYLQKIKDISIFDLTPTASGVMV